MLLSWVDNTIYFRTFFTEVINDLETLYFLKFLVLPRLVLFYARSI